MRIGNAVFAGLNMKPASNVVKLKDGNEDAGNIGTEAFITISFINILDLSLFYYNLQRRIYANFIV